ncbi:MAG: ATP-binding cassette domain-containing protein, partial [Oscillospiraceae bacterium]|nr:ATP-binding cassette domain-containing protein [Oscillospiraceae bacterium]
MPKITLTHVTKRWDKFYAVDDLNLVIEDNAFVTLLGPSGCGKTTTLRMIAGLETPTSGKITIGDKTVFDSDAGINIPPNKRKVGFLFQNYALWPNMTVYQNISFGLSNIKEELPKYDLEARRTAALIEALKKPEEVVSTIRECVDKKGKLDVNKAHIKLIDHYEISIYTAKELMGYKLHEASDPAAVAAARSAELEKKLDAAVKKCFSEGCTFNDDYAYVKDGKTVTEVRKLSKEEIDLSVRRVSRIVKIGMFMDRYPAELSGGQQQRVAIARTLAPEPSVLFMDEPLSNLDAKLRLEMRSELQRLHLETGSTFVYVTHDQMEAMTLATKICLIENGLLQQYDAPLTVYGKPNNTFVADFVGNPAINFIDAKGTQKSDGSLELCIFDGLKARFVPNAPLSLDSWYSEQDASDAARKEAEAEKAKQKGYIHKVTLKKADILNMGNTYGGWLPHVSSNGDLSLTTGNNNKIVIYEANNQRFASADIGVYSTHAMINPVYPNLVLYSEEGTAETTFGRIRMFNRNTMFKGVIFDQYDNSSNGGTTGEAVGHEGWSGNGEYIVAVKYRKSTNIGKSGIIRMDKDGNNREYINDDYDYWHCAASYDGRWIIADTIPVSDMTNIVLIDAKTGKSHLVARQR